MFGKIEVYLLCYFCVFLILMLVICWYFCVVNDVEVENKWFGCVLYFIKMFMIMVLLI